MTRKLLAASVAALIAFAGPSYAQMSNDAVTGGQGTVTNVATACGISGGPITSTGTIQSTANPTTETGANYAFQASDMCTTVYLNNASNQIPTIAQANTTGFENGKFIEICNIGAGTQTLTPTTSTIGGASTYILAAGSAAAPKCVGVIANAGNYTLDLTGVGGGSTSFANPSATAGPSANNGSATTAMRSDASPAIQLGTNAQTGLAEGDNVTMSMAAGVVSTKAGAINHPGYQPSIWYNPLGTVSKAAGANALAITVTACSLGQIGGNSTATISALGIGITTLGTSNIQLALYNNDFSLGIARPGTLVDSTPSIVNTSTGSVSGNLNATHSISPGWYWFCIQDNDTTVRYQVKLGSLNDTTLMNEIGSSTIGNATGLSALITGVVVGGGTFGTWPNLTGATFTENVGAAPAPIFKFSSVP